jgi:hypothetical protein
MCGAKDRTRLRACGRERVIDFDGQVLWAMDVAFVLDQVENRAFDPSQASVHDGLSVDANLVSLIATRHRQPDRSLHDAHI